MTDTSATKTTQPEPYELDKCTVKLVILLHPVDSTSDDADCTIAVSTHDDIPLTKIVKQSQLNLPKPVTDLLEELKADLPQREFHARVKQSKTSKQKTTKSSQTSPTTKASSAESNTSSIKQVQLF